MQTLGGKLRFVAFVLLIVLPFLYPSFCRAQNAPVGYGKPSIAVEASRVFKTAAGSLYDMQVNTGATAGWVLLYDAAAAPSDGAGQTPIKWYQVAANATLGINFDAAPLLFGNGLVAVFSTTGPFTQTSSATATFSGEIK